MAHKVLLIFILFIASSQMGSREIKNYNLIIDETAISNSCTIFTYSNESQAYFCSNEDYREIPLYYWAIQPTDSTFGGLYFGFDNIVAQGGVNEKGLAFDFNGLPLQIINDKPHLLPRNRIFTKIMKTCSTIDEVIATTLKYNFGGSMSYQIHYADKNGNAVVISAGKDGELAYTLKESTSNFLLSANYNLANHTNSFDDSYPCWRTLRANVLFERFKKIDRISIKHLQYVLDATHIEGGIGNTLYSYICDLKEMKVYLNYWHQFYETVELEVAKEIDKNTAPRLISELFSDSTVQNAKNESTNYFKLDIQ